MERAGSLRSCGILNARLKSRMTSAPCIDKAIPGPDRCQQLETGKGGTVRGDPQAGELRPSCAQERPGYFGLSFSMKSALTQYEAQLLEPQDI